MGKAKREVENAEAALNNVREGYSARLSDFNAELGEGIVNGSRTLFDHNYLLGQAAAAEKLAQAEDDHARLMREARAIGPQHEEDRTEGFVDRSDDGYKESAVRHLIERRLDHKRIRRWLKRVRSGGGQHADDGTQGQAIDPDQIEDSSGSEKSVSECVEDLRPIHFGAVSTFSQAPKVRAEGSKKMRIERWQKQQERTRRDATRQWAEKRRQMRQP